MKAGLLICDGEKKNKNIGDFIQSIAAEQFTPKDYLLIEREKLNSNYSDEEIKVIMNGWFMFHPENWPPADNIIPLFTSFHIVPSVAERLLTEKGIAYFKKYEPIGCRDYNTLKILEAKGIKAYFSGCLTLTLKPFETEKKDQVLFVDPYYESYKNEAGKTSVVTAIDNVLYYIFHIFKLNKFKKIFTANSDSHSKLRKIKDILNLSAFYKSYSHFFSDEILFNARYISHNVNQSKFSNTYDKLNYAKDLLKQYKEAKFVVTSRIHCALPCLAIEEPVMFISSKNLESSKNPIRSPGRFKGLIDLFRVLHYTKNGIIADDQLLYNNGKKIDSNFSFENKDDYKSLRENLIKTCENFYK